MSDINFCNTKEQLTHLGEVVTGKVDGSPTGADIDTSTLPYTGQVRKTLPALEEEYQADIDNFVQVSDQLIVDKTAEFDTSIANKEAEADAAIDSYRLLSKGDYASGILLSNKFEFIEYNGEAYFATNPPYTTTATLPDADGNLFISGYTTFENVANKIGNKNELSNSNFLTPSPDAITHPNATPESYVAGTQIFSGVYAGDSGCTITLIDGRVNCTAGDYQFKLPNNSGLERVPVFTSSVSDYDGIPKTTGVSYALVSDEYVVTVTPAAGDVFSVKFEQGEVATAHEVQSYKGQDYTFNTVEDMTISIPPVGSRVTTLGYYTVGDGGGAEYLIVNGNLGDGFVNHNIGGNTAKLMITENRYKMSQCGATTDQWHDSYGAIISHMSAFGGEVHVDGRFSDSGTFNFPSNRSGVVTKGDGLYQSALINSSGGPVIEFGTDQSQTSLALIEFKNLDVEGGSHGLFMSRDSGSTIAWERMTLKNVRFLNQSDAWVKATGEKVMYLVNTHERVIGNGVKGFDISEVFSCNLNHWDLCRFEAMSSYHLYISTTNNECVQNTMRRGRHEANTGNQEQILVQGGSQSFKVEDDYFENCPTPSITLDASTGLNLATEITGNTLSSNTVGDVFVKLLSQCFDTSIVSNVLKPGLTAEIQGNPNCKRVTAHGNGDSTTYSGFSISAFYDTDSDNIIYRESTNSYTFGDFKGEVGEAHSGDFSFSVQLPKQGVYDVTVTLKEDGDISLGGVLSSRCAWIVGGASILGGSDVMKILNPNTANISLSNVSASGLVTFDVDKGGDSTSRVATINYTIQTKDFNDIH